MFYFDRNIFFDVILFLFRKFLLLPDDETRKDGESSSGKVTSQDESDDRYGLFIENVPEKEESVGAAVDAKDMSTAGRKGIVRFLLAKFIYVTILY